jgi:hypothetical protein
VNASWTDGLFLPIDLAGGDHRSCEGDPDIRLCFPIQLNHADNDFVAVLRFLKSKYTDA